MKSTDHSLDVKYRDWQRYSSRRTKVPCQVCGVEIEESAVARHTEEFHGSRKPQPLPDPKDLADVRGRRLDTGTKTSPPQPTQSRLIRQPPDVSSNLKSRSTAISIGQQPGQDVTDVRSNFRGGSLWTPHDASAQVSSLPSRPQQQQQSSSWRSSSRPHHQSPRDTTSPADSHNLRAFRFRAATATLGEFGPPQLILEPITSEITLDQLVPQVKHIYAGLVKVEAKCIEVDNYQARETSTRILSNQQWRALALIHRTLIYEHHDFLLSTNNPIASEALVNLAEKYSMPGRLWRHGIHSFLELLRTRLPESREHMLTFLYHAFGLTTLLYETITRFRATWVECLGDLARYRMAIEELDIGERVRWTAISRTWYVKASSMCPNAGRLYHHLSILSRPSGITQLFWYAKSLCVSDPFASTRESSLTLFDPILADTAVQGNSGSSNENALLRIHGALWTGRRLEVIQPSLDEWIDLLKDHLKPSAGGDDPYSYQGPAKKKRQIGDRLAFDWNQQGYLIGIANCAALVGYMARDHPLAIVIRSKVLDTRDLSGQEMQMSTGEKEKMLEHAIQLNFQTYTAIFSLPPSPGMLDYLHVMLVFVWFFCRTESDEALQHVKRTIPWELLRHRLNILPPPDNLHRFELEPFPGSSDSKHIGSLREDRALRGLLWAHDYFPPKWFPDEEEEEGPEVEDAGLFRDRLERVWWLAVRIAESGVSPLQYNFSTHRFEDHIACDLFSDKVMDTRES